MKKILNIMIIILLGIVLVSCGEPKGKYQFISLSNEYKVKNSRVDLHFKEDSVLPYISIERFVKMLDGVYYSNEFEFIKDFNNDTLTINIEVEDDKDIYSESIIINAELNTIDITSLDFFSLYVRTTETDYGEGLIDLEPIYEDGISVTYDLNEYDFDVLIIEKEFYMPLFLTNLIFNQDNYFDVFYNGDVIYGFDTSQLKEKDLKTILKSEYNEQDAPMEVKLASYNFYRFLTDYFYGLKDDRNITNSKTFIDKDDFLSGDLKKRIFEIVKLFDDLHTSHNSYGVYKNDLKTFTSDNNSNLGSYVSAFYRDLGFIQNEAVDYFGVRSGYIDVPDYEIINNDTAVIYLMGFDVDTPDEVEDILKDLDETVIKNVIIDLSLNTGGNLGAVLRIFTLMTNEEIWYHIYNKLDQSSASYGVVGEKEAYDNFNYVIKSSRITFSAANLMVSIGKELGFKIIGAKSSGGASPISYIVFPEGSIINISSLNVLADKEYNSIETGIVPDVVLNKLYNKSQIKKAIGTGD